MNAATDRNYGVGPHHDPEHDKTPGRQAEDTGDVGETADEMEPGQADATRILSEDSEAQQGGLPPPGTDPNRYRLR